MDTRGDRAFRAKSEGPHTKKLARSLYPITLHRQARSRQKYAFRLDYPSNISGFGRIKILHPLSQRLWQQLLQTCAVDVRHLAFIYHSLPPDRFARTQAIQNSLTAYSVAAIPCTPYISRLPRSCDFARALTTRLLTSPLFHSEFPVPRTVAPSFKGHGSRLRTFGEHMSDVDQGRPPQPPRLPVSAAPRIPAAGIPESPEAMPDTIDYDPVDKRLLVGQGYVEKSLT